MSGRYFLVPSGSMIQNGLFSLLDVSMGFCAS